MSAAAIRPEAAGPGRPGRPGPRTGFGHSQIAASTSPSIPAGTRPLACAAAVSFRSAPEQNTGPVWSSTTTRTAASATRGGQPGQQLGASARVDSALRLRGLSRVSVVTPRGGGDHGTELRSPETP